MRLHSAVILCISFFIGTSCPETTQKIKPRILLLTICYQPEDFRALLANLSQQTILNQTKIFVFCQFSENETLQEESSCFNKMGTLIPFFSTQECLIDTFNRQLACAEEEYIFFLHPHAHLFPQALLKMLLTFEKKSTVAIAFSDFYTTFDPKTTPIAMQQPWYASNLDGSDSITLSSFIAWRTSLHTTIGYLSEQMPFFAISEFIERARTAGFSAHKITGVNGTLTCNYKKQTKALSATDLQELYREYRILAKIQHSSSKNSCPEKHFCIITPSYNNITWYEANLSSLLDQEYTNYHVVYIDDASTDGTADAVQTYLNAHDNAHRVTLIKNSSRHGALANIYHAIQQCSPTDIIVLVDGDDFFAHPEVLTTLNRIYQGQDVWITYGQFVWFPQMIIGSAHEIPSPIILKNDMRKYAWCATHLRTFYAGLFHHIHKEDLLWENTFFPMAWDLALMFPMLEMAGSHSRFIPDILYLYNTANSLNDHKIDEALQEKIADCIRKKQKYTPIDSLF